jgi:hypothetical protein
MLARRDGVCPRVGAGRLGHRYNDQGRFERPYEPADRQHRRRRTVPFNAQPYLGRKFGDVYRSCRSRVWGARDDTERLREPFSL